MSISKFARASFATSALLGMACSAAGDAPPLTLESAPSSREAVVPAADPQPLVTAPAPSGREVIVPAANFLTYFDTTPGNTGKAYRSGDVDIESCQEGGFNISWLAAGEWLTYDVDIPEDDTYEIVARTASPLGALQGFLLELDGVPVGGWTGVSATRSWQLWQDTVAGRGALSAGRHSLRLSVSDGFNVRHIRFSSATRPIARAPARPLPVRPDSYQAPVERWGHLQVVGTELRSDNLSG